ncbi:DUF4112 domain-containing protein [Sedimentitalea todarodis]|uniref:DUF4112 domain-containing protein n=1 Tax=Sedimentitalea todarodis TaxID=1631240 RepID=A0ABU3VKR3_9RHOB|nr:DUF4112 domain-containing protein [Sedimentitalea todarodis]MDU9006777.1 DUF4112 domain-containing protein [Sedimentitalea todarodis]
MPRSELEKLDDLSKLLDSRYRIPGTPVRFGWDSLIGLIPGVGDIASLGPSAYLIYRANKLGVRKRTIGRMAANTGLDFFVGAIPVLSDVFDLIFKANNRNFALLRDELAQRPPAKGD